MIGILSLSLVSNGYAESMPSCAGIAGLTESNVARFILIAVDQTTSADTNLMNKFIQVNIDAIQPATKISSYTFSAFSQGKYLSEQFTATLDAPLSKEERYQTSKKVLNTFDRCIAQKHPAMTQTLQSSLQEAMQQSNETLVNSDVIHSLKYLAEVLKKNPAQKKYLVVFSDMLENSSITSFYAKNGVRQIDPTKELVLVEKSDSFADFGGAKIYVMGAGLLSEKGKSKGVYRDPKTLHALEDFWKQWFAKSNAQLVEFGMPEMLGQID